MNKKAFIGGPISHLRCEKGFTENFVKNHMLVMQILQEVGYQILSAHIPAAHEFAKLIPK